MSSNNPHAPPGATVVVVGSLNMDLVMRVARVPEPGETVSGKTFAMIPGGKGANQAVACARMGAATHLIGQVGDDDFGLTLRTALTDDPIALEHVGIGVGETTGIAMIMVDDNAQNRIALLPGANATLTPVHIERAGAVIDTSALLIAQLEVPPATVFHALQRAARRAVPVLLNPAPAQPLPEQWWSLIDYLVPNESEASALTGMDVSDIATANIAARWLRDKGVAHVLITLGAQGVVIADAAGVRHYPAIAVDAVDTTAAGDTFIGGLAAGLVEGMTIDAAAQLGLRAASVCVTRAGAQTAIPYRGELADLR